MNKFSSCWLAQESFNYYFFHFTGFFLWEHTYSSKFAFFICFSFALFFFSSLFYTFLERDQITHMTNEVFHSVSYADSYLLWDQHVGFPFTFAYFRILRLFFFISTYASFTACMWQWKNIYLSILCKTEC